MKRQSRKGFTLIELLVVVAIIALLIAILIPSLGRAKELANRSACGASLTGILKAMTLYSASNTDQYPVVLWKGAGLSYVSPSSSTNGPTGISTSTSAILQGYFNSSSYVAGDPMACMWVLVLSGNVSPKQFICKSDPAAPTICDQTDTSGLYYDSFGESASTGQTLHETYSYSIAYPWVTASAQTSPGAYWRNTVDSSIPIASDMAPANGTGSPMKVTTTSKTAPGAPKIFNSNNHSGGEGQNVVFADTHVEFANSPYVGQSGDNIWCTGPSSTETALAPPNGSLTVSPTNSVPYDLVFVPFRNASNNLQ